LPEVPKISICSSASASSSLTSSFSPYSEVFTSKILNFVLVCSIGGKIELLLSSSILDDSFAALDLIREAFWSSADFCDIYDAFWLRLFLLINFEAGCSSF